MTSTDSFRGILKTDPFQPEEKDFKYNIWGGGYGRGGLTLLPGSFSISVATLPRVIHKLLMVVSPALSLATRG